MITAIVAVETVLLVLLVVLVAGLLRSHAELLRRLGPEEGEGGGAGRNARAGARSGAGGAEPAGAGAGGGLPVLAPGTAPGGVTAPAGVREPPGGLREPAARPVLGTTLEGDAVKLDFAGPSAGPTLLAFLTSGCSTCARFWAGLGQEGLPPGLRTVIVTRSGDRERPARLRRLAPDDVPVVMSSQAWEDYAVPGAPYFLLVDGEIRGEGVASTWEGLTSLVADAIEDERLAGRWRAGERRGRAVDATLAAHGIGPGHASLYPGSGEGS